MFTDEIIQQFITQLPSHQEASAHLSDQQALKLMVESYAKHLGNNVFLAHLKLSPFTTNDTHRQLATVKYVKLIHDIQRQQDRNHPKPIILLIPGEATQIEASPFIEQRDFTPWICVVLIPKNYSAPQATDPIKENRLYIIGALNHEIPKDLETALKHGMNASIKAPNGKTTRLLFQPLFPKLEVKTHIDLVDHSSINVKHSALLAICHALMLAQTGNDDYLNQPLEMAGEIITTLDNFSNAYPKPTTPPCNLFTTTDIALLLEQLEIPQAAPNDAEPSIVDYYSRVYTTVNEQTFLIDTLKYLLDRIKKQKNIQDRNVLFVMPYQDGSSRLLALHFREINETAFEVAKSIVEADFITSIEAALQNESLVESAHTLYQNLKGTFINLAPDQPLKQQLNRMIVTAYAKPLPLEFTHTTSSGIDSLDKGLALLLKDNLDDYEGSEKQRQLWHLGIVNLFEKHQTYFPQSAKLVKANLSTIYKFMLLHINIQSQFKVSNNTSLYTLNQLQKHYNFIKQKIYELDINPLGKLLPYCTIKTLQKWSSDLQSSEMLLQTLALQSDDKRRLIQDWETGILKRKRILQAKRLPWLINKSRTLCDTLIQRSIIGIAGRFFEAPGHLLLRKIPRHPRRILIKWIRRMGYLMGATYAYHAGYYFFMRGLFIGSVASYLLPDFSTVPVDDETATLREKPARPIGGFIGTVLFVGFLVTVTETVISQNRQHLINYFGGIAGTLLMIRLAERISPTLSKRPLTSLHQANLLFLITLMGHWLGREAFGLVAQAFFKIRLCLQPEAIVPTSAFTNDAQLISARCVNSFQSFRFWWSNMMTIDYDWFDRNSQQHKTQCTVQSHHRYHFFDHSGHATCETPNTDSIKLLTS